MNENLFKELKKLFQTERFPSTILLYGGYKINTQSLIKTIVQTLLCENKTYEGCQTCHACTLFKAGNHPDFFTIDIQESGKVENLREALRMYSLKSYLGISRVTVIENADRLNPQSANLLLKTLEEPLPESYFILTASQTSRLPITILSRCQKFFLGADLINEQTIKNSNSTLSLSFLTEEEKKILYTGDESILEIIAENRDQWIEIKSLLDKIIGGDGTKAVLLSRNLTKSKEKVKTNSTLLMQAVRLAMLFSEDNLVMSKLATVLVNLISFEYLAFERNLSATSTLLTALLPLLDKNFIVTVKDDNLLSEIVV